MFLANNELRVLLHADTSLLNSITGDLTQAETLLLLLGNQPTPN